MKDEALIMEDKGVVPNSKFTIQICDSNKSSTNFEQIKSKNLLENFPKLIIDKLLPF